MKFAVIFEKAENNYSAYVPDRPGCVAAAATFEETEQLIREAIEFHLEGMMIDGDPVPAEAPTRCREVEIDVGRVRKAAEAGRGGKARP